MLYAEIRRTERIITAAKASRYGEYQCPTCKAEVFLKAGDVYVAHFAHMPGQGKPECDDYYPPDHLRRQWGTPPAQPTSHKIDGLALSIELEPDHDSSRGLRRWSLRLTVPKSYDIRGQIRIDLGGGDKRPISLTALADGARTYTADPAAPDFGAAWVSPDVRPEYREAVTHRIAGLNTAGATAFAVVPQKLKPRCGSLRWGASYYFVWRSDLPLNFPSNIERRALGENRGWSCCLLVLPDKSDPDVAAWFEKASNLQIIAGRSRWALIYPPPFGTDDDGNLNVHSSGNFLLAIKSIDDEGELTCLTGQQSNSVRLAGGRRHLVEIGVGQQRSPRPIHLAWEEMPLNSLASRAYPEPILEPAVLFEFIHGSQKTQMPLHWTSCKAQLVRVRLGDELIVGVSGNHRLRGTLLFRQVGVVDWQSEDLNLSQAYASKSGDRISLPSSKVDRVNAVLKDRSLETEIDFGPFGTFVVGAVAVAEATSPPIRLPWQLGRRIEWLCKASGAFLDTRRRPIQSLDDAALLGHLSTIKLPAALLVNQRALQRELRQIAGGPLR
jgi:hypothetical protein